MTQPPTLNTDSEATVDTCMAITSRAIRERIGYTSVLFFHHAKMSNSLCFKNGSAMYLSNSLLPSPLGPRSSYKKDSSSSFLLPMNMCVECLGSFTLLLVEDAGAELA